jgi:RNA polymerase sigma-70 factor (ECF subfamily)
MPVPDESQYDSDDAEGAPSPFSDETATQLFRDHNRALVGYLTARLRCQNEAKEVAQEAYVRLLQLQRPGTPSLFRAYLFKTATNLAIDRLRRRTVRYRAHTPEMFDEIAPSAIETPEQQLLAQEFSREVHKCFMELPDKCRQVFTLHRVDGLDQRQVALRLGFSERMVRRYITYAMTYCRLRMDGIDPKQVQRLVTL